jgi:uncharacterized protein (UPF0305 family)
MTKDEIYAIFLERKEYIEQNVLWQYAAIKDMQKDKRMDPKSISQMVDDLHSEIAEYNTQVKSQDFNKEQVGNLLVKYVFIGF